MNIAIFASGNGSNFERLVQEARAGHMGNANIRLLVCDRPGAAVCEKAVQAGIPVFQCTPKTYNSRSAYEKAVLAVLVEESIDLVVLAGYLRIIGSTLLEQFEKRIVNIHPSLLPAYPGLNSIERAYNDQMTETGITIHYIDDGVDTGPIIRQEKLAIDPNETLGQLEERIHQLEHTTYPEVLKKIIEQEEVTCGH